MYVLFKNAVPVLEPLLVWSEGISFGDRSEQECGCFLCRLGDGEQLSLLCLLYFVW